MRYLLRFVLLLILLCGLLIVIAHFVKPDRLVLFCCYLDDSTPAAILRDPADPNTAHDVNFPSSAERSRAILIDVTNDPYPGYRVYTAASDQIDGLAYLFMWILVLAGVLPIEFCVHMGLDEPLIFYEEVFLAGIRVEGALLGGLLGLLVYVLLSRL